MAQQEITLKLSPDEINIVLEGIGNLPFVKVYNLIGKIQSQAASQLSAEAAAQEARTGGAADSTAES